MKPVALAFIFIWLPAAFASTANFAAAVYSPSTDRVEITWDQISLEAATATALKNCGRSDCTVLGTSSGEYIAVASSPRGSAGFGHSDSQKTAVISAFEACKSKAPDCRWRSYVMSTGHTDKDIAVKRNAAPQSATLTDLGGKFSKTIPNFVGVKQKHDHWCWAAATETIYFAMTGAHLDQGKLARIQTNGVKVAKPAEFSEFGNVRLNIRCLGLGSDVKDCDHAGYVQIALNQLGISAPFITYPDPTNAVAVYKTIRESLSKNVPVGMTISWFNGDAHAVVIYGADFRAAGLFASAQTPARITLKIFDPFDGKTYVTQSTAYLPDYERVPGDLTNWVSIADASRANRNAVSSKSCDFLTDDDRAKFCAPSLQP